MHLQGGRVGEGGRGVRHTARCRDGDDETAMSRTRRKGMLEGTLEPRWRPAGGKTGRQCPPLSLRQFRPHGFVKLLVREVIAPVGRAVRVVSPQEGAKLTQPAAGVRVSAIHLPAPRRKQGACE